MPTAATNEWWQWTIDWNDVAGGSDTQTGLGILTNVTTFDIDALCSNLNDTIVNNSWLPAGVTLEQSTLSNGFTGGVDASGFAGSGGTCLPFNSGILVRKEVPTLPNTRKGRMFLPGVQIAGVNTAGNYTGTYRSDLQANMDGWLADIQGIIEVAQVIQFTAPATSGGSRTYEIVTGFTVTDKIGTLRRRIRR